MFYRTLECGSSGVEIQNLVEALRTLSTKHTDVTAWEGLGGRGWRQSGTPSHSAGAPQC